MRVVHRQSLGPQREPIHGPSFALSDELRVPDARYWFTSLRWRDAFCRITSVFSAYTPRGRGGGQCRARRSFVCVLPPACDEGS